MARRRPRPCPRVDIFVTAVLRQHRKAQRRDLSVTYIRERRRARDLEILADRAAHDEAVRMRR